MRKLTGILLAVTMAVCAGSAATAETLRAPDYVIEGFDGDSANHDWETNLFFQRMQERTGIAFEFRQYTDEGAWKARKEEIRNGENLPDVLFKAGLDDAETLAMAKAGVLMDLKPYLPESAPDLWALLEGNPAYLEAVTLPDGTIRALPGITELASNNLMWINQTWLKNVRMEAPTTAEELTEVLRAFRDQDPNRNGRKDEVPLSVLGMWDLRFLAHAFGIVENDYYVHTEDGKAVSSLTSDENRAFLTWLKQLWEENLLSHQSFTTVDSLRQITDSNAAVTYGMFLSTSPLSVVPSTAMDQYAALDPLTYEGKRAYRDLLGPVTKGTFALTSACKEPEKILSWVNYLYTEEGSMLIQAGAEGEEYFWNEDGKWEWIADLQTVANEVLPNATLSEGGIAPGIVTMSFQVNYAHDGTNTLISEMARVKDFAVLPFPQLYLTEEDSERIAALQAELSPFAEKRMAEFVTGDTELDDAGWQAFCAGVEERGLPEMLTIWQRVLDER